MHIVIVLILLYEISALSYDQPKLCPTAKWNQDASPFAGVHDVGTEEHAVLIFIDANNTFYVTSDAKNQVIVRSHITVDPTTISYVDFSVADSIFVSNNGDIYIAANQGRVYKWTAGAKNILAFTGIYDPCTDLFVDVDNNLYCSMFGDHIVLKRFLNTNDEENKMIIAGTRKNGWKPNQLDGPRGIFVDINFDLYVADYNNHRIQLFYPGEARGKTVAGHDSSDITTILQGPVAVVLDADKFIFITEYGTKRIVGSGPNGFRCLVGCDEKIIDPNQFEYPRSFSFDVYGNIFVCLMSNVRIQKFHLQKDSCVDVPSSVETQYSSILTANHTMFSRATLDHFKYHYEEIEIIVREKGFYVLTGNSSIDLYGHVYKDHFDRFNPKHNLIAWYGKCCNRDQFKFTLELLLNTKYILVVTTYNPNVTGPFSITVFGSNTVHLQRTNSESVVESVHSSALTTDHPTYARDICTKTSKYYYEALQMYVNESGFYTILSSSSNIDISSYIYKQKFYSVIPSVNLFSNEDNGCNGNPYQITVQLETNVPYILIVSTCVPKITGEFSVKVLGSSHVSFQSTNDSPAVYTDHRSQLTGNSSTYDKQCTGSLYHYETTQLSVPRNEYYAVSIDAGNRVDIYLYENQFDPYNPKKNSIRFRGRQCRREEKFRFTINLRTDIRYIILVSNKYKLRNTHFTVGVLGLTDVNLDRFIVNATHCYVGGSCNIQVKSIGLTLDDILRLEVKRNMTIHDQPLIIKIGSASTIAMLVAGVMSSVCSILTFQNQALRQVGCGLYLLASSVTSLLSVTVFTVKFWFVVVTQMDTSIRLSVLQGGCKWIETLLKLFFYWDTWLNACVATERAISVYKGVNFNKKKSKRFARWIIFILPFGIMVTIIHEPLYRQLFSYDPEEMKRFTSFVTLSETRTWYTWCITSYPQSIQDYNTSILFIHLLGPFIINLLSAVLIIIGTARRRAEAQNRQNFTQHMREQW
ncbi:unnamed protein product, partial [Adineta ricciae]